LPFVELYVAAAFALDLNSKRVFLCHLRLLFKTEKREWTEWAMYFSLIEKRVRLRVV